MKTWKRALCMLLTLAMMVSMFTIGAFAEGEDPTAEPQTATIILHAGYPDGPDLKIEFEAEEGEQLPLVAYAENFSLEGHVFNGWARTAGGKMIFSAGKNPATTWFKLVRNGVLELYALWAEDDTATEPEDTTDPEDPSEDDDTFTVIIDYNRGEDDDIKRIQITAGTCLDLGADPKREGYRFMGWYTTENGKFHEYNNDPIYGPCTITAHWTGKYVDKEDWWEDWWDGGCDDDWDDDWYGGCSHWGTQKHTVKYTDGVSGKTIFKDQVYTVKDGAKTPEFKGTPVRAGYKFVGWSPKVAYRVSECVVYEATWSRTSVPSLTTEHIAYIQGDPTGLVRPNDNITRAEAAALLYRLLSDKSLREYHTTKNPFTDVDAYAWYNTAVSTLYNAGIITGNGYRFNPESPISRAELAAMLSRFSNTTWNGKCSFRDVSKSEWYYDEIGLALQLGWITGDEYGFRPNDSILRCEAVAMINRVLERDCHNVVDYTRWSDNPMDAWYYADMIEAGNTH